MSKRSKACDIPKKVKEEVWERDGHRCIICGDYRAMPNAHYIARSHGGLGIPQNIVTLCLECHHQYDNGKLHIEYKNIIQSHLRAIYGDEWNEENLIYKKGVN
ncbi:MAG: HNH endonuclease [Eubacterium sp.]